MTFALIALAYTFAPGQIVGFDVEATFSGYLPVLGGRTGTVQVKMGVEAQGLPPDDKGLRQMTSEIKSAEITMNGALMPLGLANIQTYFPKTTIGMTPEGKVLKTDAPDITMPFRLPGLDVQRFPDISYLPIQFPVEGVEQDKPFSFKKAFGDSDVTYVVTPTKIDDASVQMAIKLTQQYVTFESAKKQVVEEKEAAAKVVTDLDGSGTATFDRKRGFVSRLKIDAEAVSKVTNLQTKEQTERRLKTGLAIRATGDPPDQQSH